ncbi:MAG: hypothetical protein H0X34_19780 [Chthoniobacterales bacterium]|nr:hypothetical protein [Chthoniobacterales bacterium]
MPVDGLFADLSCGIGSVCLPDTFTQLSGALQLAIVRDWRRGVDAARNRALVLLYRETVGLTALSLPAKLARFHELCAEYGEDRPPDMARLLQHY